MNVRLLVLLLALLPKTKAEAATDTVAVGAVSSPLWLHQYSGVVQDLVLWLGAFWLITQIGWKWYRELKK